MKICAKVTVFLKFSEHQENKCFQRQTSNLFLGFRANPRLLYGYFLPMSKSFILSFLLLLISFTFLFYFFLVRYTYFYTAEILICHSTSHSYMCMKQLLAEGNQLSWELLKIS